MRIAKPHSPIDVLRILFGKNLPLNHIWSIQSNTRYKLNYHGYVGLSDKKAMQCIFLNHRLISCFFILKSIIANFKKNLDLSFYQKMKIQNENIFILLFITLTQDEFTLITKNGKKFLMFHDMQKILNSIKACIFKCNAEEITVSANMTYSNDAQLLKQIYLKPNGFIFKRDDTGGCVKNMTSLAKRQKIIITGTKRKIATSSVVATYSDKQCKEINDIKVGNHQSNQPDITYAKYKKSQENQITKKLYNEMNKIETHCNHLATINDLANKTSDYHDSKNDDFVNISLCSEWSDWTYCSNNKERSVRNVQDAFSENDACYQRLFEYIRQFDFLPKKLYSLLQYHQSKITNIKYVNNNSNSTISCK